MVGRNDQQNRAGIRRDGEFRPSEIAPDDHRFDAARVRLHDDDEAELGIGDDYRQRKQPFAGHGVEDLLKVDDVPNSGTNCFGISSRTLVTGGCRRRRTKQREQQTDAS
jgi:hypothetical protein